MRQSERLDICIAVTLALILALACLPQIHCKRMTRVDLEIPVPRDGCMKKVTLIDCDLNFEPPKCKSARVEYSPPSCAIVHLN